MKKLLYVVCVLAIIVGLMTIASYTFAEHGHDAALEEPEKPIPEVWCPVTLFTDNDQCLKCHVMLIENGKPKFGLKEIPRTAMYTNMPYAMHIITEDGVLKAYITLTNIDSSVMREVSHYLYEHPEIKRLVIELHSPGGSVMAAWRCVGIIEEMRGEGIEIETRCYGMALSAGGILLVAGDIGKRSVNRYAEIMIHKVWQFSMFDISDPDSAEDKAAVLKHLQANINQFFKDRTDLEIDQVNENTYHKQWWLTGAEAVELGVADKLI